MTSQKKEPCKEQEKEEKKPIKKTEKLKHEEEHVEPTLNIGNQLKILIQEFSWEGEDDRSTLDTQEMEQHELVYIMNIVENPNTRLILISCSQGILCSSSLSCSLLLRLLVYMYLSQLMRTFTNYLKCIVISS